MEAPPPRARVESDGICIRRRGCMRLMPADLGRWVYEGGGRQGEIPCPPNPSSAASRSRWKGAASRGLEPLSA